MSGVGQACYRIEGSGGDEMARSLALHSFDILDTPCESDFDDLVSIASRICDAPFAVVNLVDTARQFFKAEVGLGVRSTPIQSAFCRHALLEDDVLVIPDAIKDSSGLIARCLVMFQAGLRFPPMLSLRSHAAGDGIQLATAQARVSVFRAVS